MKIFSSTKIRRLLKAGIILNVVVFAIYLWGKGIFSAQHPALNTDTGHFHIDTRKFKNDNTTENSSERLDTGMPDFVQKQILDFLDFREKAADSSSSHSSNSHKSGEHSRLKSAFTTQFRCNETVNLSFLGLDSYNIVLDQDPVCLWIKNTKRNPENNFVTFGDEMALVHDVSLDPSKFKGTRGGEAIKSVLEQSEDAEYFTVNHGAFSLRCSQRPSVVFNVGFSNYRRKNHLNMWLDSLECRSESTIWSNVQQSSGVENSVRARDENKVIGSKPKTGTEKNNAGENGVIPNVVIDENGFTDEHENNGTDDKTAVSPNSGVIINNSFVVDSADTSTQAARKFIPGVTLAVTRYEYANVHHTMADFYSAFLALLILGIDPKYTTVLIVDGHPWGKFDGPWSSLFGGRGVFRVGHLPSTTTFEYMVWIAIGYQSPIYIQEYPQTPYLDEMRAFFFKQYGVEPKPHKPCPSLHILLVLRRDYLAHPRNPTGQVQRKIANEQELAQALREAGHVVHDVQLDLLPISKQLAEVGQANVMLGMHGAGLTWSILLEKGSGLIEIAPLYFPIHSQCFKAISKWRGLHHIHWTNLNASYEQPNYHTYISPNLILGMVNELKDKICSHTKR